MKIEKLTADNFYTWHNDLLAVLWFNDLLPFINSQVQPPSDVNSELYARLMRNKVRTFSIIRGNLSASFLFLIDISQNDPFKLYKSIVNHCNTRNDSNINCHEKLWTQICVGEKENGIRKWTKNESRKLKKRTFYEVSDYYGRITLPTLN